MTRPLIDRAQFVDILEESESLRGGVDVIEGSDTDLTIQGVTLRFDYVDLLKDLLLSGCSGKELLRWVLLQ